MARILNIETSTMICSVSVSKDGEAAAVRESNEEKSHAKKLTLFIEEIMDELNMTFDAIDAVAISKGPGSYTGLRIGVSTAKGICYAKDKPLIAVNTLQSMAYGLIHSEEIKKYPEHNDKLLIVPMIDARRMEVYSAFFSSEGEFIREVKAEIIDEESYQDLLPNHKMIFFGDGSDKIKEVVKHENAVFIDDIYPSAKYMAKLSEAAFNEKNFEDVAYFEPFYLKDFIATVPKKNIFK
ncbi:MAG: tRNA (adenosine(37)-N6)-threonylcarbamoyltransferase complex dimerization subunit type 1 TsaB [Bacteroidetes bacterium]|nr:tRNA (adenosine(37)-N6)-threonylcarbamoyltransferase complex dimerization subunit type 1 TsaB [Bacteroidota bacterium]